MTHPHPHFDLTLHDDDELAAALGSAVIARETLAEWPLSCVQRVCTADGGSIIYKAQAEPTVEPQFYAAARSTALPAVIALPNPPGPAALLLEDVAALRAAARVAARLADLYICPTDAPGIAEAVLAAIAGIRGDLPALADLSTPAGYEAYVAAMLGDLAALVEAGALRRVGGADVGRIARAARSAPLTAAARRAPAYLHGDLTAENVFLGAAGPIIIDWQRPLRGPADLDRACLLESLDVDPRPIVAPEIMALLALTRIAWLAACARRWFPPGVATYDAQIAALAAALSVM